MSFSSGLGELFDVNGLVVVITGGGSGIGKMYATALENNGAIVYIIGRRLEALEKTAKECSKFGNIIPLHGDVMSNESIQSFVAKIEADRGYINLLINNAGIALNPLPSTIPKGLKDLQSVLWNTSVEDFDQNYQLNVRSIYYVTVAFLHLLDAGNAERFASTGVSSQVITVGSMTGFRRDDRVYSIAYAASKAAELHLGKLLCGFLKDHQIRSNVICPGLFPSEQADSYITPEIVKNLIPLKRSGNSDDMAGVILFLASKAGGYLNGCVQLIDGGRLSLFPSTY